MFIRIFIHNNSLSDMYHINLLESFQRRFTSNMACFLTYDEALDRLVCSSDYSTRLAELKIYSLHRRRERYIILQVYKIIIGLVTNTGLDIEYNPRTKINVKPKLKNQAPAWIKKSQNIRFLLPGSMTI